MVTGSSLRCVINSCGAQVDHNLFEVICGEAEVTEGLGVYLNSGIAFIQRELLGRANLGDGALKVEGIDWRRMFVPERHVLIELTKSAEKEFRKLCRRRIKDIRSEAKRKDRIIFEKAVLRALSLPEELAENILTAVVGLVEERHILPKLRSTKKRKRISQDLEKLREEVGDEILPKGPKRFPEGFVRNWKDVKCEEVCICEGKVMLGESFFDRQEICDVW